MKGPKAEKIQQLFDSIAKDYDKLNHILSLGVDTLRESVLKNRLAMERFCYARGGKISGGWTQNYGYIVETEHYRYCLRCNPSPGDYNCYCTAYDLDVQRQNMAQEEASRMEMGGMA